MKGKQLALLLVLVAALGGAWYFLSERTRASWSETNGVGGKVVTFPINEVARVTIRSATGEVNLLRKEGVWTVQERADYPASFQQVSELLRKFWDLKTVQEVKAGPSQLPRLELIEPGKGDNAGTLVEFRDKDGRTLNALLLGKTHVRKSEGGPMEMGGFPAGRYVKTLAGTKISLVSEAFGDCEPKPERWLEKDFLKIEGPKSVAVVGPTDAARWTVTRESATTEWKLADAQPDEKLDPAKASALGSVFAAPSFSDVLASDAKPEDTGLDQPTVATIETFDGFRYELRIGKAIGESHPVLVGVSATFPQERPPGQDEKPDDKAKLDEEFKAKRKALGEKLAKEKKFEGRPYLVAKFLVEPLLKERAALSPDKPVETTATDIPPQVPKIEAVTPPVKVEAFTPPVQAPPLPSTPAPAKPARKTPAATPAPTAKPKN